ncbi:glycosyltransferase family 2 protein [Paenibacillus sp. BSR1-1]|uniref:glycosyltransferase family 2 protein n=1 Tax=Paenibacillus sp. BSR1-1 TaxID=3020845 RepID=UPI0025AF4D58|nr:glycosyltransferase family 2 protein [Paenibacillus sp. BSR1-1]MDN3019199.1 glycosyltransferase family 2 protein [Paenibacillus sp. BSR1-1]
MNFSISIALCTYNGERFLEEQLESILKQSRLPEELVVCDDCSSDGTIEILERFKKVSPFRVYIYNNVKNLRSTKNFQNCISLCNGDIIFLCDQDDYWNMDKLEKIEREFINNKDTKLVFTNALIVDENLTPLGYSAWETFQVGEEELAKIKNNPFELLFYGNKITGATMAFRKDCLHIHEYPNNWIHDGWISILIAYQYPNGIKYLREELILYRQHGGNQIGGLRVEKNPYDRTFKNNKILIDEQFNYFKTLKDEVSKLPITNRKYVQLLDNRLRHLKNRNSLSINFLKKLPIIFKELVTLRYFRYSNGFRSAIKDMFITR